MGSVHHLLCREEGAVLASLRDLFRFRQNFDNALLGSAERSLAGHCGAPAKTIVSQGLLLTRILGEDGFAAQESGAAAIESSGRRASDADLRLLALLEAAQSSRSRLEALLPATLQRPSAELLFVLIRFSALLLSAGLRLPRRGDVGSRSGAPATFRPRPELILEKPLQVT